MALAGNREIVLTYKTLEARPIAGAIGAKI